MKAPGHQESPLTSTLIRGMRWLAAEPFRLFFFSGAVWSAIGVSLWPLFFAGKLGFYPNIAHARLMVEVFGGAFVIGFLGTAGPRMATAPKLLPLELAVLFFLHLASGYCHLRLKTQAGDVLFLIMLVVLLAGLIIRVVCFGTDWPPPQMLLALTGLFCGIVGTFLWLVPATLASLPTLRLAGLLLYQGFLLPPVLGIGTFIFPRMLGGDSVEPVNSGERRHKLRKTALAALFLVMSFPLEAWGWHKIGYAVRTLTAAAYLVSEVTWRAPGNPLTRGSLAAGLHWSLGMGLLGLALPAAFYDRHIAVEHLLYIGGFGLLIFVVASRVLFGHSGDLPGFARRSRFVRGFILLALLAAATRASADFFPAVMVSHYNYAALTWATVSLVWLAWHRKRFITPDSGG